MKICRTCEEDKLLSEFSKDTSKKDGHCGQCKDCFREYQREYNRAHREELSQRGKDYYEKNKSRLLAQAKEYWNDNKKVINEKNRRRYAENPELIKGVVNKWRSENSDKVREFSRKWAEKNPEKRKISQLKRSADKEKCRAQGRARDSRYRNRTDAQILADRARLRPDGLKKCRKCREAKSFDEFHRVRANADGLQPVCKKCWRPNIKRHARFTERGLLDCVYCGEIFVQVDHVWPSSKGGRDHWTNYVPSCVNCNESKQDTIPWIWLEARMPGQDHKALLDSWGIDWKIWPKIDNHKDI